jgi:hypothetical protein
MARVNIEEIIDDLSTEMRSALEAAVKEVIPQAQFDRQVLFRAFKRAVGRKCNTWESVSDSNVEVD